MGMVASLNKILHICEEVQTIKGLSSCMRTVVAYHLGVKDHLYTKVIGRPAFSKHVVQQAEKNQYKDFKGFVSKLPDDFVLQLENNFHE